MEAAPAVAHTTRKRKAPVWLSDCFTNEANDESSDASLPEEAETTDADNLSDDQYSPEHTKRIAPSSKSQISEAIWPQLTQNLDRRLESSPRQNFDERHGWGLSGDDSGPVSLRDSGASNLETTERAPLCPSKILDIPTELLARILSCLPINILLQASGVGQPDICKPVHQNWVSYTV